MNRIELNEHRNPDIRVVGNEQTPVIVIDDPIVSTDMLRQAAIEDGGFHLDRQSFYPGVRTILPDGYVDTVLPLLLPLLREVYEIPGAFEHQVIQRLFSLIATPPEELGILQRVPHIDAMNPWYFATVHHLNPGPYCGTGIFRHRPTGFERLTSSRYQDFVAAAEAHMKANGVPPAKYIDSSTDHFELIETLEYRQNRMLIYPGNLLHSGLVQPERDIGWDPRTGRLTANLFIDFVEPGA
jgi:hypothetical protein